MGGGMIGAQMGVGGIFGGTQLPGMGGGGGGGGGAGLDLFGGLGGLGQNPGVMFQGGPVVLPKQVLPTPVPTPCNTVYKL